jgi:hypothetical protein
VKGKEEENGEREEATGVGAEVERKEEGDLDE